jgi:hypothetical protein
MAAHYPPVGDESFLGLFGTPALLWRVLNFAGYMELPRYSWNQEDVEGYLWFVAGDYSARAQVPQWQGWSAKFEGRTPWEGAQVIAFEILGKIYQQHGDELTNTAVGSFPQVNPAEAVWVQHNRLSMVRDRDERAESSSPAMSAMFAVMQMFYAW